MRTIQRAFMVLQILAGEPRSWSLMEISKKARLDKATCLRFLRSLEDIGVVRKDARNHGYELGPKLMLFSSAFLKTCRVEDRVRPYLEELVLKTEETAYYSIRNGDSRVALTLVESPHETRTLVEVGIPVPLSSGSVSRAMLAFLDQEEIQRILSEAASRPLTSWSIAKPSQVLEKISEIRLKGYAIGIRERAPTTNAVAAPVFDRDGVIGSLAIVGPAERLTKRGCERLGPVLRSSARGLSEEMGYQGSGVSPEDRSKRVAR